MYDGIVAGNSEVESQRWRNSSHFMSNSEVVGSSLGLDVDYSWFQSKSCEWRRKCLQRGASLLIYGQEHGHLGWWGNAELNGDDNWISDGGVGHGGDGDGGGAGWTAGCDDSDGDWEDVSEVSGAGWFWFDEVDDIWTSWDIWPQEDLSSFSQSVVVIEVNYFRSEGKSTIIDRCSYF